MERNDIGWVCEKTANYDLMSVAIVCLGNERDANYKGVLKLLGTLLTSQAAVDKKKRILQEEFDIDTERSIDEEVLSMCNLSQGIEVRGIKKGLRKGRIEGRREGCVEGLREGRTEGRTEGLREGRTEGIAMGRREGILVSIRSLMKRLNLTVSEAMNALDIPAEERQSYIEALAET
ncbi:hypothetical protein IJT17_07540 [bacterium]|nr:hypothetical protein [bacterium]